MGTTAETSQSSCPMSRSLPLDLMVSQGHFGWRYHPSRQQASPQSLCEAMHYFARDAMGFCCMTCTESTLVVVRLLVHSLAEWHDACASEYSVVFHPSGYYFEHF